jgi:hypothetical protein
MLWLCELRAEALFVHTRTRTVYTHLSNPKRRTGSWAAGQLTAMQQNQEAVMCTPLFCPEVTVGSLATPLDS